MLKVVLTGARGQLGKTLIETTPDSIDLFTPNRAEIDLAEPEKSIPYLKKINPDWIINAAAFTNVDGAEKERQLAFCINGRAPGIFSNFLKNSGGRLLQISTDFVFDGNKNTAYTNSDKTNPINTYGQSKLIGERETLKLKKNIIIRTSWLYSPHGKNFLKTMLRLHYLKYKSNEPLRVISDQIGCPTSCKSLSKACWQIIINRNNFKNNIFQWSDYGVASWYDFAVAIGELAKDKLIIDNYADIQPIKTKEFPTPANRPKFSLMDCENSYKELCIKPNHWRESLSEVLDQLKIGNCSFK